MPFPIINVTDWPAETDEQMGSKPKTWVLDPRDGNRHPWLYKQNWRRQPEDWSEKIACEVAELLGLPHAQVELAERGETIGAASKGFVFDRDLIQLVHGNELIKRYVDSS